MADAKTTLRRHYRQTRRAALDADRARIEAAVLASASGLLGELLGELNPTGAGPRVGLYWPLAGELDLRDLARQAAVALPAIHAGQLRYRPWRPGDPLSADACGIPAPAASAGELAAGQLDLLLIPALAIDQAGIRLGYGGGWYDRLRADPAWRRPRALAVLPAACCAPRLPQDPWDVPLDGWISETGLHWRAGRPP